ncbi:NAD-dependent epimerase/dehydratase family protein [Chlamydiota bacterium]
MKVLLVGGAGFVGAVLAEELLIRGYAVRIFDRFYFGNSGLKEVKGKIEVIKGDMRVIPEKALDRIDVVVNLGGLSNDPTAEYNPQANIEMNTKATVELAKACKKKGINRYIFASSCSIYDIGVKEKLKDVVFDEESKVSPKAAYSSSKYEAEKKLLSMVDKDFCPVILRKGTIYGFSPRMRYDLVVNTFVKDVLLKGFMTIHYGGEMWRPLVDVRDAARAYIACIEADEKKVKGEIFNVVCDNFRISEVALRVKSTFEELGIKPDIKAEYKYWGVRNYRVSSEKMEKVLGIKPKITIEESVKNMVEKIKEFGYCDFSNPKYYNINWVKLLEEADEIIKVTGYLFDSPKGESKKLDT